MCLAQGSVCKDSHGGICSSCRTGRRGRGAEVEEKGEEPSGSTEKPKKTNSESRPAASGQLEPKGFSAVLGLLCEEKDHEFSFSLGL